MREIVNIEPISGERITFSDGDQCIRYSSECWNWCIGNSSEMITNPENLEKLYQDKINPPKSDIKLEDIYVLLVAHGLINKVIPTNIINSSYNYYLPYGQSGAVVCEGKPGNFIVYAKGSKKSERFRIRRYLESLFKNYGNVEIDEMGDIYAKGA
jgi:hypothetical protein